MFNTIVRKLLLTGQRREEVSGLQWSDLDLDLCPNLARLPVEEWQASVNARIPAGFDSGPQGLVRQWVDGSKQHRQSATDLRAAYTLDGCCPRQLDGEVSDFPSAV